MLTAFTAAQAFGLTGWERESVHVLAAGGTRLRRNCPVPVTLHLVADLRRVVIHRRSVVHALPDALLRAAATFRFARPGCGLLAAAV